MLYRGKSQFHCNHHSTVHQDSRSSRIQTEYHLFLRYDEIKLRMPKGKKEIIQAHAAQRGESVNAYINRAIDKAMSEDDSST